MARVRLFLAATIAAVGLGLGAGTPASAQAGPPTVSITPASGPIGTEITATVANCPAPAGGGQARLDFAFEGFTPANSELFTPDAGGAATVTIEATEKAGQSENLTAAEVTVSQCGNEGVGSAPFSVTRSTGTTTTTSTSTPTSTSSTSTSTTTTTSQPPESVDSPSAQPPSAVLVSPTSEVDGDLGSYCWTVPAGPDLSETLCVDKLPPDPGELPLLRVSRGAPLSVRFDTSASPTETQLLATSADGDEQRFDVVPANPARFSADLDPGVYLLSLFTRWDSGDAVYFFQVQVDADGTAPTTSTTRMPPPNRQGRLPATGSDVGRLAGMGATMVGMGGLLLLAHRHTGPRRPDRR